MAAKKFWARKAGPGQGVELFNKRPDENGDRGADNYICSQWWKLVGITMPDVTPAQKKAHKKALEADSYVDPPVPPAVLIEVRVRRVPKSRSKR